MYVRKHFSLCRPRHTFWACSLDSQLYDTTHSSLDRKEKTKTVLADDYSLVSLNTCVSVKLHQIKLVNKASLWYKHITVPFAVKLFNNRTWENLHWDPQAF